MAEVTNYIDRLVAELCPDGVEYRPLGEIADVTSGYVFPVKYQGNEKSAEDNIPFYKVSDMNLPGNEMFMTSSNNYVSAESAKEMRASLAQSESIIFPKIGAAIATNKKRILTEKSIVDNNVMVVTARSVINSKFLYYVLSGFDLMSWSMGAGAVPSIKKSVVVKHEVPVPPLEIQEAIVEILDKFTNLEAELEAELEARTLQHEYYRDSLFEALDCPRVPLGSFTQYSKDRKRDDSTVSVYVGVENLKSDFQGCAPTESTNPGVVFQKGDILLGNIRPYLKKMWRADSDGVASPDVLVIRIRDEFSEKISSRYLYHLLASNEFVGYNVAHSRGGKMPRGNKAKILEFEAPIPSLEEQQRIVDILDRFDALTTSLSEGLPAELAARRSQYEYYRDQLLSFPRKGENQ